ncbi:MAG: TolC family protein [Pseudomonadota bacterium]
MTPSYHALYRAAPHFGFAATASWKILKTRGQRSCPEPLLTRFLFRWFFALFTLLASVSLQAQPTGALTERDSVDRVLQQPAVQAWIKGALDNAQSDILEQSRWKNPTFEYALSAPGNRLQNATEQIFVISQPVDLSGRRGLRREAAEMKRESVAAETQSKRLQLAAETRHRFFAVLHRQRRVDSHRRWMQQLAQQEKILRTRYKAGDVSGYDLRRLARELASAEAQFQSERAQLQHGWEQLLALWQQDAAPKTREVSGELLPTPPHALEKLLDEFRQNPVLTRLAKKKSALELNAQAAGRWAIPEFDLGIGAQVFDAPTYEDTALVVNLALPLPLWSQNNAERMRYHAQAQMAESQYQLTQQKTAGEIRALWQQTNGLIQAAEGLEKNARTVSEELLKIAASGYKAGEFDMLELLDAHREHLRLELETLDLAFKAREADIELDRMTATIGP